MNSSREAIFFIKTNYLTKLLNELSEIVFAQDITPSDVTIAEVRLNDIATSFTKCLELYEGLSEAEADEKWNRIRSIYYKVTARVKELGQLQSRRDSTLPMHSPIGNSTFIEKHHLLKLPVIELPRFSGDHEQWLSFKNSFLTLIDRRTDFDNVAKLIYLRNSLQGEALNKVGIYDISVDNYSKAWQTLLDSYERKRKQEKKSRVFFNLLIKPPKNTPKITNLQLGFFLKWPLARTIIPLLTTIHKEKNPAREKRKTKRTRMKCKTKDHLL